MARHFLEECMKPSFDAYFTAGCRSNKKVTVIHNYFRDLIKLHLPPHMTASTEICVPSCNISGNKRCDIVIQDTNGDTKVVFPVKFISANYKQNQNNYWEQLTGEITHLYEKNNDIKIVPINITTTQIPYKKNGGEIKTFEQLTYESSFEIYEKLKKFTFGKAIPIVLSYLINVEHLCQIGEKYDKRPKLLGLNEKTPWVGLDHVLKECGIIQ